MKGLIFYFLLTTSTLIFADEIQKQSLKCHPLDQKDNYVECDNEKIYQKDSIDYSQIQKNQAVVNDTHQSPNKRENDTWQLGNSGGPSSSIGK